jgi:hypothetical protein
MLYMCVMNQPESWENYLPLVEFAYNDGYQHSLKKVLFEPLYGKKVQLTCQLGQFRSEDDSRKWKLRRDGKLVKQV